MTAPGLEERVRPVLARAVTAYRGRPGETRLLAAGRRLDEPLRVALVGRVKAGKSTLLNALVGRQVAATDAGECTRVVTRYVYGPAPVAVAHGVDGARRQVQLHEHGGALTLDLAGLTPERVAYVEVALTSRWLRWMSLVDTPGLGSLTATAGARTTELLGADTDVDAIIHLMRHLHLTDVDFLEVFAEARHASSGPINAVGVLSRADEIGGGGPDALDVAARVAGEYCRDPRIRALVHTVVPVAGLLGGAASSLTPGDVDVLAALARAPEEQTAPLLLSADRFARSGPAAARLLALLGLYGVRHSVRLLRQRAGRMSVASLGALLGAAGGLPRLRELLLTQFAERQAVLKADSALRVIEAVTSADPVPAADELLRDVERLRVNAHELTELSLLTRLRMGQVRAGGDRLVALERILGGDGTSVAARLGLPDGASPEEIGAAADAQRDLWRRVTTSRLAEPALVRAAEVALRTCDYLTA